MIIPNFGGQCFGFSYITELSCNFKYLWYLNFRYEDALIIQEIFWVRYSIFIETLHSPSKINMLMFNLKISWDLSHEHNLLVFLRKHLDNGKYKENPISWV